LEQELDRLKLAHLQAVTESNTHKEQYEAERQKLIDAESSLQDMFQKLHEVSTHPTFTCLFPFLVCYGIKVVKCVSYFYA
jgi:hypothetical protein